MDIRIPADALARVNRLLERQPRVMLGLAGAPGAGKSTLASALQREFSGISQVVPMDGFHLANVELQRLGIADRKGAPHSFDASGFVALLQRLRAQQTGETVYAPEFRREIEEPVAGAIAVFADTRLLIVEGNYLLLDKGPWAQVRPLLDEAWYVGVDDGLRNERLVGRHQQFGRSRDEALAWIAGNDGLNAELIEASRGRADYVLGVE